MKKQSKTIEKYKKNYLRNIISKLITHSNGKPIIIKAKYKHNDNNIWATFIWVKPYIEKKKTYTLCNHINIERNTILQWYNLTLDDERKKFYIIGYPYVYNHYGDIRGGIKLATDINLQPIYKQNDFPKDKSVLYEKCYLYKEEELDEIRELSIYIKEEQ
jgi:hypothetical protein